jgi:hypothetical protein
VAEHADDEIETTEWQLADGELGVGAGWSYRGRFLVAGELTAVDNSGARDK